MSLITSTIYDGYNRLSGYADEYTVSEYTYNLDGLRESKTVNNIKTRYAYDGANIISEITEENIYTYTRGTELIGYTSNSGDRLYYVQDGHGNVTALLNEDGTERKTYNYNPYGKEEEQILYPMGSKTAIMLWRLQVETPHNPFRYCGEYYDDETDLIYLRNRYYYNQTGRFITEDPIKDGLNWYSYCGNDPINNVDPWGLKSKGSVIGWGSKSVLDVRIIQMTLNDLGFTGKDGKKLDVDGDFKGNTQYAVKQFQKSHSLKVDGKVGDITWKAMGLMLDTDITNRLYKTVIKEIGENSNAYDIKQSSSQYDKLQAFYHIVRNKGPLDLKQKKDWLSNYFIFDGKIVSKDAPGNIAYGIAGKIMGISEDILFQAAGIAQQRAGTSRPEWKTNFYGDDPMDQINITIGINYYEKKKR